MKRILFLIPPYFNAEDYLSEAKKVVLPAFTVPYGVLSLEAYLVENVTGPTEIDICDLNISLNTLVYDRSSENYQEVFEQVVLKYLQKAPQFVCISALFSSSAQYIQGLVAACKRYDPAILTLAGGGLPSADSLRILQLCPELDAICKGEGERPLLDLIEAENPVDVLERHISWITRRGAAAGKIPQHLFLEDLDTVPFFNYDKIDLNFYNNRSINKKNRGEARREMSIHTSRGCPFNCVFCSNPSLHGHRVRAMSVSRVIADVQRMKDRFGMTDLLIEDDHFFHNMDRAKTILKELSRLDIRIEFPNGVAVYAINDEIAGLLSSAGVSVVALAVESGSEYVLNTIIKKPLITRRIRPAIDSLRRHNVGVHVFIVVGLPGEKDVHRQETVDMLLENDFDWVHMYLAVPIVGSRLYDICIENGYIDSSEAKNYVVSKSVIRTPDIDPVILEQFAYETQLRVNFVHNSNMRHGRYDTAQQYLQNVCEKYPGHAFGHHYLSVCLARKGDQVLAEHHSRQAGEIFAADPFWRDLRDKFITPQQSAIS
ncbi:MAG: radical SAM protein [Desulfocapsaceae bacterium]|nr:radical SAM protein [Desulfocapsaceae bacterium]